MGLEQGRLYLSCVRSQPHEARQADRPTVAAHISTERFYPATALGGNLSKPGEDASRLTWTFTLLLTSLSHHALGGSEAFTRVANGTVDTSNLM